ncbi:hypothetical protein LV469_02940 [Peptoniphilus sp. GNH]|nr:hypothetical protein LV469_02940 [Peptoniphilus sp. GNH]
MIKKLRESFVKELNEETNLLVVQTDSNHKKPKYPYYSYKFIILRQNTGEGGVLKESFESSLNQNFKYDVVSTLEFQPKSIMSFNAYSDDLEECEEAAIKAWEWFRFKGRRILSDYNYIVVNVGNITDRTVLLGEAYEYRYGFDVEFRLVQEIKDRTETIESYKIEGGIK